MVKKFRGQSATLEASDGNLPADPFGVIDDPEVAAPEQEVQELRGAGSTEWQDLQKTETAVTVSGTVLTWDIDTWDRLVDYDDAQSQLDDSADVQTFTVTVTYTANDGSTKELAVQDCYVDGSVPLGGSREDWIGMDLSFRGRTVEITNTET